MAGKGYCGAEYGHSWEIQYFSWEKVDPEDGRAADGGGPDAGGPPRGRGPGGPDRPDLRG